MAARDIVYFDGLRKLFYVKKRRDRWELACLFLHPNHGVAHHRSHLFSIWVLLTTPTRSTLTSALGLCGVVSLGWWVPSHTLWYPKHDCIFSPYSSSDNEKSSRAAASLLGNMWQYTKLHRDFKVVRTSLWGGRAYGRAQGSHGWGLHPGNVLHPNASRCMTCPDSTPSLYVEAPPEHHPYGARCLEGWEHPCVQSGHSMPEKCVFAFPVPTSWQSVAIGVLKQGQ